MVMWKTTPMELDAIIKKLPNKASHGHDEVSNVMLKALRTSIVFPLCHIFNHSIMEGKFPTRMKLAEVIPLYKGKSMDQMVNYRPISLLITLSKLLEKIIYQRIYKYFEDKSILYSSQYGFHNKRSCEQAMCELTGYVLQSKNRSEHSASIYLDLSKAFDTLDHNILLQKLDQYSIRGVAREWIEDYLRNRSLVTKITTCPNKITKSEAFNITCGAAQGSCLGLLLFIIFLNDIHLLLLYSKVILFADDTTIFNSHKTKRYLQYMIDTDLQLLQSWFSANKLSLNVEKTVAMKFWDDKEDFHVSVNGWKIPLVRSTKFLGVYMDNMLSWHLHINHVMEKLNNNRRLLQLGKKFLNTHCKRNVYFGHIHSHLVYGILVWGSMVSESQLNGFHKIQDHCIHIISSNNHDDIKELYTLLSIQPIDQLIKGSLCKLGHSLNHKQLPSPLIRLFNIHGGEKTHRYPMQNKNIQNVQKHKVQVFNRSFLCRSLVEYGKLPTELKTEKNKRIFDHKLKHYLTSD